MKKPVILLSIGMIGFVVWLTLCLINPWAGFIVSLCGFIGLTGFIIFILICYVLVTRANKRALYFRRVAITDSLTKSSLLLNPLRDQKLSETYLVERVCFSH